MDGLLTDHWFSCPSNSFKYGFWKTWRPLNFQGRACEAHGPNMTQNAIKWKRKYSYNKSQRVALFLKFILIKNSTCFGQSYCPSSGVSTLARSAYLASRQST
jgi:hypothetical protein